MTFERLTALISFISIASSVSAQLSRSFTEEFTSNVDSADRFEVFVVEDVVPENGVKFIPSQGFFVQDIRSIASLPFDNAYFTYTEPGVYVIVPFRGLKPLCFGSYVVMNEDYLEYYLDEESPYETVVTEEHILNLTPHTVGDSEMPLLSQARWNE